MNEKKLTKLTRIYIERYNAIPEPSDLDALLSLADAYDGWFLRTAIPHLESLLTIDKGLWQIDPAVPQQFARFIEDACARIVIDGVSQWLTDDGANQNDMPRIADYFLRGLDLWRLNLEMLDKPAPRKLKMTDEEIATVQLYNGVFMDTHQDHLARHIRHVRRAVNTAMSEGWTTDKFREAMTAPDGHIVGFMYGNSRLSWYEHLRRFGKGKMRMLAQIAQQGRM